MNEAVTVRTYQPGDAIALAYLQMEHYRTVCEFGGTFEYYLTQSVADWLREPSSGQLWVAELDGRVVGGVAIMEVEPGVAQLRWYIVDDGLAGRGIGNQLMDAVMTHCVDKKYELVFLWTASVCDAAKHLYAKRGFKITETKTNEEWCSHPVIEEKMELRLDAKDAR